MTRSFPRAAAAAAVSSSSSSSSSIKQKEDVQCVAKFQNLFREFGHFPISWSKRSLHDDKVWTCKNYYYRFDLSLTRSLVQLLDGDMQMELKFMAYSKLSKQLLEWVSDPKLFGISCPQKKKKKISDPRKIKLLQQQQQQHKTHKHTHIGPSTYQEWCAPRWFSSSVSPIASSESSHPCTEEEEEQQQQKQNKQQSLLPQTTPKLLLQNDGEH